MSGCWLVLPRRNRGLEKLGGDEGLAGGLGELDSRGGLSATGDGGLTPEEGKRGSAGRMGSVICELDPLSKLGERRQLLDSGQLAWELGFRVTLQRQDTNATMSVGRIGVNGLELIFRSAWSNCSYLGSFRVNDGFLCAQGRPGS